MVVPGISNNYEQPDSYTIEEVYEVVDAIERKSMVDLEDELGDLLFQVVFTRSSPEKQISFPSQTSLRR